MDTVQLGRESRVVCSDVYPNLRRHVRKSYYLLRHEIYPLVMWPDSC